MNFYSNKLKAKNYLKLFKNYKKEFVINNFGSFLGDKSFYRWMVCFELIKKTKKIKGDIVEFGVWNGNNLFTIKKVVDYLNMKKKIIGYDHFKGMPNPDKKNNFKGNKNFINKIIKFYNFNNIQIIDDDMMNLKKNLKHFSKLSFIYIDCDIYKTTAEVLKLLNKKLSIGGIIAFDEGNYGIKYGEGKAVYEFYKKNKSKYKKVILKKFYQPDIYLQKIK
jgi:Macrocin-O-methyltransferase (TylF).|tara:strand:+ start:126 stop:785 length:660 start_codon:yes stop_codon:yes gene_type:complete